MIRSVLARPSRALVGPAVLCAWSLLGACASNTTSASPLSASSSPPSDGSSAANRDRPMGYPGTLRPVSSIPYDFLWQQRVTATWQEGSRSFDAALQKQGDTLTLIGLAPMGTPAFVIQLHDGAITFENYTTEALPFSPEYIMLDVHRVFFPWLKTAGSSGEIDGEHVSETLTAKRLTERRFRRVDGQPPGEIVVTYEDWQSDQDAPGRAVLDNRWFGYRLTVETFVQQRL